MMKRTAVVDYGIDYGLHNMHGTAGLYYVSNPVSCIIIYALTLTGSERDVHAPSDLHVCSVQTGAKW